MDVETIYKVWCPECGKHMYINNGDVSDLTVEDVQGAECPHCGKCFKLHEDCDNDDDGIDYDVALKSLA